VNPADDLLVGFKQHLRVKTIPAEGVYLLSEHGLTTLSGSIIELLAPLLDGTLTVAQVKRAAPAGLLAAEIDRQLARLWDAGLICFRRTPGRQVDGMAAYWSLAGLDAETAIESLASAIVAIVALGDTSATMAARACRDAGLTVTQTPGSGADVSLVVCDDYLDPELAAVNAEHLAVGRPWLLARPSGTALWTGPVFRPRDGPCWACLSKRVAANRPTEPLTRRVFGTGGHTRPTAMPPGSSETGLRIAVLELCKWLAGLRNDEQQAVYILDTLTVRGRHHPVRRRAQCAACGDPGLPARRSWSPPALRTGETGPESAQLVLERYEHLIDPVTGIVAGLHRDQRSPDLLPCYLSRHNPPIGADTIVAIRDWARTCSGGKGATDVQARAGALCEAVERYCATRNGDEARVRDSYRALGSQAVDPRSCLLFDERQYANRARWNAGCAPIHQVPETFDEFSVLDWTPVWSLLTGQQRLLPTALLYLGSAGGVKPASLLADSAGNAAGSCLGDAIVRGFLELVERDAVAIWWYNRTRHPGVCLESFDDPWVARLPSWFEQMNRALWVLDVTSDLGVPVMAAVSRRVDKPAEDVELGFGAHPDARVALRHALAELGQQVLQVSGSALAADPHLLAWCATVTTSNQPHLKPDPAQRPRLEHDYQRSPDQDTGLSHVRALVRDKGLDPLVLDLTRLDVGMPVAKVVVPGLRHIWPRFAPGRLFDVPVRMGQQAQPTAYEKLNPVPLYT
jgi:bacteriocin biosynthesis cyclodehydratase domain-containing protein